MKRRAICPDELAGIVRLLVEVIGEAFEARDEDARDRAFARSLGAVGLLIEAGEEVEVVEPPPPPRGGCVVMPFERRAAA